MIRITHTEAHSLIQQRADQEIDIPRRRLLDAHLTECAECRTYASDLREVEHTLLRIAPVYWSKPPAPLTLEALITEVKGGQYRQVGSSLPTRIAAVVIAFLALMIGTWQLYGVTHPKTVEIQKSALPVPTPSTQPTNTDLVYEAQACKYILYDAKAGDTLESIALRFNVSLADLTSFNELESDRVIAGHRVRIPLCRITPTIMIDTPTTTITITPQLSPISTTPG